MNDPTLDLCIVDRLSFDERRQLKYLPPVRYSDVSELPNFNPVIKNLSNTPPVIEFKYVNDQEISDSIIKYEKLLPKEHDDYRALNKIVNPFEKLGNSIFMNRAALKIADIDAYYNFTYHVSGYFDYKTYGPFKFCDIAAGPGGFTEYIQFRRPESVGFGITLKTTDSFAWNFKRIDKKRFFEYYGPTTDCDGDIFKYWRDFSKYAGNDCDFACCDGGLSLEEESGEKYAETSNLRNKLFFFELIICVYVLKKGGNCICKMFKAWDEDMAQYVYFFSRFFDNIALMKPIASRSSVSERFFIGCNFLGQDHPKVLEGKRMIEEICLHLTDAKYPYRIFDHLPDEFVTWLSAENDKFLAYRLEFFKRMVMICKKEPTAIEKFDLSKVFILWNIPSSPFMINTRDPPLSETIAMGGYSSPIKNIIKQDYPYISTSLSPEEIVEQITFPYYDMYIKSKFVIFDLLKYTDLESVDTIVYNRENDFETYDVLSYLFNERVRPYRYHYRLWNDKNVLLDVVKKSLPFCGEHVLVSAVREEFNKLIPRGELITSSIFKWFVKMKNPKSILDTNPQYGDKLITALALKIPYTCINVEDIYVSSFNEMIRLFAQDPSAYKISKKIKKTDKFDFIVANDCSWVSNLSKDGTIMSNMKLLDHSTEYGYVKETEIYPIIFNFN